MLAVAGSEVVHAIDSGADERFALFADAGAQSINQTNELEGGLPGEKFADVLFDYGFGAGDFTFAGGAILLDDFGEVFDVVDVEVVEVGGGGIDIAGDAEVHYEESAIRTSGHDGFENRSREDRFLGRDGRNDYVRRGECGVPIAPFDEAGTELRGERLRAIAGAIHYV